MKTVAIVQARMGSTRLPGKVLIDLGGQTVLQRVVERLRRSKLLHEIVVATTTRATDEPIMKECGKLEIHGFRGSEQDVLERYHQAALESGASTIVRITADCPLIDSVVVDETVRLFAESQADYTNNLSPRTYPRGLDVEVMKRSALERAWQEAADPHQREHVTPYLYEHPAFFRCTSLTSPVDHSAYRWTLDTPEDLQLITQLYARLNNRNDFGWQEVVGIMEREPHLAALNAQIVQKTLHSD